jgi:hypothetical protein
LTRGASASAGKEDSHGKRAQKWTEALDHMRQALHILDDSEAPAEVGADLDLAMSRLSECLKGVSDKS